MQSKRYGHDPTSDLAGDLDWMEGGVLDEYSTDFAAASIRRVVPSDLKWRVSGVFDWRRSVGPMTNFEGRR